MEIKTALAIIILMISALLIASASLLAAIKRLADRNITTLAGIQTRLTAERKRDLKKGVRK